MTIIIHSFPASNWENIFLFNTNSARSPGVWLYTDSDTGRGFHVFYTNKGSGQTYQPWSDTTGWLDTFQSLEVDTAYKLEIYFDQQTIIIKVNGKKVYTDWSAANHALLTNAPIYMGASEWAAADVSVYDFDISSGNCLSSGSAL